MPRLGERELGATMTYSVKPSSAVVFWEGTGGRRAGPREGLAGIFVILRTVEEEASATAIDCVCC